MTFKEAHEVEVPVERQVGVHATLHQDASAADRLKLANLLPDLLEAQGIAVGLPSGPVETAEAAADGADVRVVNVAIDEIGDDLRVTPQAPDRVRGGSQLEQGKLIEPDLQQIHAL